MIELPEAAVIAQQITATLKGKRIRSAVCGQSPHKFAFTGTPLEKCAAIFRGKTVGAATAHGEAVLLSIDPGYILILGGGGERILHHPSNSTLPPKHQILLEFGDGTYFTVTVQGWGNTILLPRAKALEHPHARTDKVPPIDEAFTFAHFDGLWDELERDDGRSMKFFLISKPGVCGIGNGYLQDILFRARIHPKRRAVEIDRKQRRLLHRAIRSTLNEAVRKRGRDTERDLHGRPGAFVKTMDSRTRGKACPRCGRAISKTQFLGGACYVCEVCQT